MNIVILTGAGISAESGIETFRAEDGTWAKHRVEDVATPEGFVRNPSLVHEFYNQRREAAKAAQPNLAHQALAKLDAAHNVLVVTQNVDDLHERGGSAHVLHMHGKLNSALCYSCGARSVAPETIDIHTPCPHCGQPTLRPDIVWFGEMPYEMEVIWDAIAKADLFVAIGTSGNVYPAAGFAQDAKRRGVTTLEINLEPSLVANDFDDAIYGKATETVPKWVASLV